MNHQTSLGPGSRADGPERRNVRQKRAAASSRENVETRASRDIDAALYEDRENISSTKRYTTTTVRTKAPTKSVDTPQTIHRAEEHTPELRASWRPCVTLQPRVAGPLSTRVSAPVLASQTPVFLKPAGLATMSLRDQESTLVDDLLFVLGGSEGQYCHYADGYDRSDEKSRLQGPQHTCADDIDPSLRNLAQQVLTTASHHAAIETFVQVMSADSFGTVIHALCAAIRRPLKDYLILIAQLEHQTLISTELTLHVMCLHLKSTSHTMSQLHTLTHEILKGNGMLGSEPSLVPDETDDDFEAILASLRDGPSVGDKRQCKGGATLALISRRLKLMSGDPAARTLLLDLLSQASQPYMTMLNEWLHHGNVCDPHQEFMINEQKSIRREGLGQDYTDEYWEKRYTVRDACVPPQLDSSREKVLLAGKYLNVVRECGGVDAAKDMNQDLNVPHAINDPRFIQNVNNAYAFANASLLSLLLTTHALPARLSSLKHYFFLHRSDFFSYFLHLADSELSKPAKSVNVSKLQSLLDIVLRQTGSIAAEDPFKEDVKVVIDETGLTKWLMQVVSVKGLDADGGSISSTPNPSSSRIDDKDINGFDALTLDFAVPFPLSLVVSRVTLTRYQLLFRYLLSLRHLERLLTTTWNDQMRDKIWCRQSPVKAIEDWKRRAWCLRSRMLCFVQQLLYFCTSEVIEPNWTAFMTRLEAAQEAEVTKSSKTRWTVDELMQHHVDFLATCLKECMLTNSKLLHVRCHCGCKMVYAD